MHIGTPLGVIALVALLVAGCSSFRVSTDYDPAVDFSQYGSYAWIPEPPATEDAPDRPSDGLIRQRIERAVDDVLATKGLRRVQDQGDASLLVAEHINVDQKLQVNTVNYGYGYGRWGYYGGGYTDTQVDQYEEGTLILDFIDAGTKQLVWRGQAKTRLRDEKTPEARTKRIRQAVGAILDRYPPAAK
jgi:hypothetical protein